MKTRMKKLIASATIVGSALAVGAGTAVAAGSADPGTGPATAANQGGHPHRLIASAVKVAADTIGVAPADLKEAVKGGQTIAQVAQSKGIEPQAVVDAIVQTATTKIDQAVQAG